jgi:hypothetical protein
VLRAWPSNRVDPSAPVPTILVAAVVVETVDALAGILSFPRRAGDADCTDATSLLAGLDGNQTDRRLAPADGGCGGPVLLANSS